MTKIRKSLICKRTLKLCRNKNNRSLFLLYTLTCKEKKPEHHEKHVGFFIVDFMFGLYVFFIFCSRYSVSFFLPLSLSWIHNICQASTGWLWYSHLRQTYISISFKNWSHNWLITYDMCCKREWHSTKWAHNQGFHMKKGLRGNQRILLWESNAEAEN